MGTFSRQVTIEMLAIYPTDRHSIQRVSKTSPKSARRYQRKTLFCRWDCVHGYATQAECS